VSAASSSISLPHSNLVEQENGDDYLTSRELPLPIPLYTGAHANLATTTSAVKHAASGSKTGRIAGSIGGAVGVILAALFWVRKHCASAEAATQLEPRPNESQGFTGVPHPLNARP
jgi:hypothetical protein